MLRQRTEGFSGSFGSQKHGFIQPNLGMLSKKQYQFNIFQHGKTCGFDQLIPSHQYETNLNHYPPLLTIINPYSCSINHCIYLYVYQCQPGPLLTIIYSPCIIARHVDMWHQTRPASGAKRKGSGSIPSLSILFRFFLVVKPTKNTDSTVILDWI